MKTWTRHEHLIWFAAFVVALIVLAAIAFGRQLLPAGSAGASPAEQSPDSMQIGLL
jgi:hypothetical protein